MGDTDNGVNCDATWSEKVRAKKKECKSAVLAILYAPESEWIAATLVCHRKEKRLATKKKAADATKKKAAEERKAASIAEGGGSNWGRVEEGGIGNGYVGVEEGGGGKHVRVEEGGGGNGSGNGKWCG